MYIFIESIPVLIILLESVKTFHQIMFTCKAAHEQPVDVVHVNGKSM